MIRLGKEYCVKTYHDETLKSLIKGKIDNLDNLFVLKSLCCNQYTYKKNLFIHFDGYFKKNYYVLYKYDNGNKAFCFLCKTFSIVTESNILNSFHVKQTSNTEIELIYLKDLPNKKSYESKLLLQDKEYIIADTLDLPFIHFNYQ